VRISLKQKRVMFVLGAHAGTALFVSLQCVHVLEAEEVLTLCAYIHKSAFGRIGHFAVSCTQQMEVSIKAHSCRYTSTA
jgi:hypothetical protein